IGPLFAGFLGLSTLVSVGLLIYRLPDLKSEHRLDSFVSRESTFLFNNLILVGAAFAVLWGTLFPILSEAVRGVKITVGPPFFNTVNARLALALVFLMGLGPLMAWLRSSLHDLPKTVAATAFFVL